ncbi:lysophospholipid acyltransferase family protein [Butyrivibrio sp. MC2013]|uniref:lysophospholipid acyltransferase family protein n=1 Tax=Butyrivibrio sp. MC2013 TaxID=1280686 RepID=UPI000407F46F|nr:hypothetical protein [Butyrivibrio sp. MC2013]
MKSDKVKEPVNEGRSAGTDTVRVRRKHPFIYKAIKETVRFFYIKMEVVGAENIPEGGAVIVGNHSQAHGPIVGELYVPGSCKIWTIAQMMNWREVPDYAYQDFWSAKPLYIRWLFRIVSYLIAPIAHFVFNNADTIPVYKDKRVFDTFRQSTDFICSGGNVIIFPECYDEYNNIVHRFQTGYAELARTYYRKTGRELSFVPMYICPALHKIYFGKPVTYSRDIPFKEEKERITTELMDRISDMALELPRHRVVPYPNVPKSQYPYNVT